MRNRIFFIIILMSVFGVFFLTPAVQAANIFLSPPTISSGVREKITVDVKIDSEGVGFNAGQVTIRFPKDVLEVSSLDKTDSAFNFWLEEPNFSNTDGVISFMGGTPYGVSGNSIQILRIVFLAKESGDAEINMTDAAITASDESGTNILSKINNAVISILPTKITPTPDTSKVSTTTTPSIQQIQPVQQIVRKPTPAKGLPIKPSVKVVFYDDQEKWYNMTSVFNVGWDLPTDISGVVTALNKQPNFTPAEKSEGLFDNKFFETLEDGVWYLHIRFKNSKGWGPVAHYRLAIDTQPPVGFDILIDEGNSTDNPTPSLRFNTSDALSGINEYQVRIDNNDIINITASDFAGVFKLPNQVPGRHSVIVKALDLAGNGIENTVHFEILPIASPTVIFINKNVYVGEENIAIMGTSLPNSDVLISVKSDNGTIVSESSAIVTDSGNWQAQFGEIFKKGKYFIEVTSRDRRGALSLPVRSEIFEIRERPILTIGRLEITQFWFFISIIIIIISVFAIGWFSYRVWYEQVGRKVVIAERDVVNLLNIINADIDKMLTYFKVKSGEKIETAEPQFVLKNIKKNIEKMQKYIVENIKEISE